MSNMESRLNRKKKKPQSNAGVQPAKGQAATKGQVATEDPDPVENQANMTSSPA